MANENEKSDPAEGTGAAEQIMFEVACLSQRVHDELPNSRNKSCILTKLDEARHWLRDEAKI